MRLGGFPQRIACCDRHTNPALREVPIQPLELPRTRDHVEGPHAERASPFEGTGSMPLGYRHAMFDASRSAGSGSGIIKISTP